MSGYINDMPDNYQWLPGSFRSPLADMGELAARVSGNTFFDRRGEVFWINDIHDGLSRFDVQSYGTLPYASVRDDHGYASPYRIVMGASDGIPADIRLISYQPLFANYTIGVEVSFMPGYLRGIFRVTYNMNTSAYRVGLQCGLDMYRSMLFVSGTNGPVYDIAPVNLASGDIYNWQTIKFVGDYTTGQHVRLIFQSIEYDTSAYFHTPVGPSDGPSSNVVIEHYLPTSAGSSVVSLGNVILTNNEP